MRTFLVLVLLLGGCHVLMPLANAPGGRDASTFDASPGPETVNGLDPTSASEAPVDTSHQDTASDVVDPTPDTGGPEMSAPNPDHGPLDGLVGCPKTNDWICNNANPTTCRATCPNNGTELTCSVGGSCYCNGVVAAGCVYTATSLCTECTKLAALCCP